MIRARTVSIAVLGAAALALALGACSGEGSGRRTGIWSAGSSTVFPFATRVAENFGRSNSGLSAPRVEALGTGGGIKAFCQGVGPTTPDIANASRQMKASEFDECVKNGVTDIIELKIGYDGIVVATARTGNSFNFELNDLFEGLAREVPDAGGRFVLNPNRSWRNVNPALPEQRIQVYGPPPTSGTRDAFLELGMTPGAKLLPAGAALEKSDKARFEAVAHTIREDNAWIDSGENDNAILQTLTRTPGSLGVFGYSFLEQNLDALVRQARIDVAPGLLRVQNELARGVGDLAGQALIEIVQLEVEAVSVARRGHDDAVIADLQFDDVGDAVLRALLELGRLHRTRGVGDVRRGRTQTLAEGLDPAAGAQGLHARRGHARIVAAEVLGHPGREGEDGRGSCRPDAGALAAAIAAAGGDAEGQDGDGGGRDERGTGHGEIPEVEKLTPL